LQQAVAFIKMRKRATVKVQSYNIEDCLDEYKRQKGKLLGFELNSIDSKYKRTTLLTWDASFKDIKMHDDIGPLAIELLNYIAYFEPDNIKGTFLCEIHKDVLSTAEKELSKK
jgi:hypothetical protein